MFQNRNNYKIIGILFSVDLIEIIGDKKKLKVLNEISKCKDLISIRNISKKTNISPTTVYRIFNYFCKVGLLKKEKVGKFSVYKKTKELDRILPKKDPLDEFIEMVKDLSEGIQLIGKSERGANLIIITDKINKVKSIENKFNKRDFKINSIILNKEQYKRLEEMKMIPKGKVIK